MSHEKSCMGKRVSKERFSEIIDELVCEDCDHEYCFLKRFIESLHPEPVVLMQFKCIELFKWDESKKEGKDIGWNEAGLRWSDKGYAKAFRDIFDEELSVREIYRRTVAIVEK